MARGALLRGASAALSHRSALVGGEGGGTDRPTWWLRQTISDARRGMRSVGEADLRRAILLAKVPEPEWGAAIDTPAGTYFVDAYWREAKVAAEADGATFHLSANDWSSDLTRQNAIQGVGVRLFRFPVRRLRAAPLGCGLELLPLVACFGG